MIYASVLEAIEKERARQMTFVTIDQDDQNSLNDWIAYITAYLGRASSGVYRNAKENQTFDENLVKVAALAVAALESRARQKALSVVKQA